MKKGFSRIALALVAFASASVLGAMGVTPHRLCEGFLPPNTMKIPVGHKHQWAFSETTRDGLTEKQFNEVIDRFERLYTDEVKKLGGELNVSRLWSDDTVNASALRVGSDYRIDMYGGLARHPAITVEGFALVICHEGGHHLGGAPKTRGVFGGVEWSTNEGGADSYATLKCLRRFFAEDNTEEIIAKSQIDPLARERCEKQFSARADQLFCLRSSLAGTSVALLFMDLRQDRTPPTFGTPDPKVVNSMYDDHPQTQCRMDTYFAGATCHVDVSVPLSDSDYREGSCAQPQHEIGWRPRCWFKP